MPHLVRASAQFEGAPVSFIAVSFDKDESAAKQLVAELALPFQIVHDERADLIPALRLRALSEMYLFGPAGELLVHYPRCDSDSVAERVQTLTRLLRRSTES